MQPILRNALIVSTALHAAAIAPFCGGALFDKEAKREMVVDYLILKAEVKQKTRVTDPELKIPERPRVELRPKVENAPRQKTEPAKSEAKNAASEDAAKRQSRLKPAEETAEVARIRSTRDYINYYQLLREKIRQNIKRNYRSIYEEGEVGLIFVLNSNGSIVSCDTDNTLSARDKRLQDLAVSSLREAGPFPPFPKALSLPTMTFTVTIVFKRD